MSTKRVVVIEGEDAAPEAMQPSVALLQRFGLPIEWVMPPVGAAGMEHHDTPFPDEARAAIDASDATFFGSTNGLSVQALFYLRWGKQTYANVRPCRWIPGYGSPLARPDGVDFVIVRENLEDAYLGVEGDVADLAPLDRTSFTSGRRLVDYAPGRYAIKIISEEGTERVVRFACELARRRKAQGRSGRVTCASKYNMLPQSDGLFRDVATRVAAEFPDIAFDVYIIDDFAHRLIAQAHDLDVVVLPNLYGDVLSDAAAALAGGLGLAPSGCYGDDYAYFESAHGTAPDIAGRHIINPTATLLSGAMMLDYLGFPAQAADLTAALARVYAAGRTLTPDQGGTASTGAFCEAVAAQLSSL